MPVVSLAAYRNAKPLSDFQVALSDGSLAASLQARSCQEAALAFLDLCAVWGEVEVIVRSLESGEETCLLCEVG